MSETEATETLSVRELLIAAQEQLSDGDVIAAAGTVREAAERLHELDDADREPCMRMVRELMERFGDERDRLAAEARDVAKEQAARTEYRRTSRE